MTQSQLITLYISTYPWLARVTNARTLGTAMARLKYPPRITGLDALTISKIGL